MTLEQKILKALELRPLSLEELANSLGSEVSQEDLHHALFVMRESKMLIEKHPSIGGGCQGCACQVSYKWRLTLGGRRELTALNEKE